MRSPAVSSMSSSRGARDRRDLVREVEQLVGGVAHRADRDDDVVAGLARVSTMRLATRLMLSASATDDPPYFCTIRAHVVLPGGASAARGDAHPVAGSTSHTAARMPPGNGRRHAARPPAAHRGRGSRVTAHAERRSASADAIATSAMVGGDGRPRRSLLIGAGGEPEVHHAASDRPSPRGSAAALIDAVVPSPRAASGSPTPAADRATCLEVLAATAVGVRRTAGHHRASTTSRSSPRRQRFTRSRGHHPVDAYLAGKRAPHRSASARAGLWFVAHRRHHSRSRRRSCTHGSCSSRCSARCGVRRAVTDDSPPRARMHARQSLCGRGDVTTRVYSVARPSRRGG